MAIVRRRGLSAEQKVELWRRWKEGQSLTEIGQALGRHPAAVFDVALRRGGFAPACRKRSARMLSAVEREDISRGLAAGGSLRQIARGIGRPASTVSREVIRHGGARHYRASDADRAAWDRALRPKPCLLASRPGLRDQVAAKLALQWSPEQIAGWLEEQHPADQTMRVSHETIYRSLFIQARGVLKKELLGQLRSRRRMRRPKGLTPMRGRIVDGLSIRERPAQIEDRAVPGHWEGDLLCGARHSQIATLVERHSRFVMLVKLPAKDSVTVVGALGKKVRTLPLHLRRSLTWDRGTELAAHQAFTVATDVKVYFCDPHSLGNAAATKTPTACFVSIFPTAPTCQSSHRPISMPLPCASINDLARPWDSKPQRID